MKHYLFPYLLLILLLALAACSAADSATNTTAVSPNNTAVTQPTITSAATSTAPSAAAAIATKSEPRQVTPVSWDSAATTEIRLNGAEIIVNGAGVVVDGRQATITAAGSYTLSGTLNDGQIIVDTQDQAAVQLILNGVNISSANSAPIAILNAAETVIFLAENSDNYVTDGPDYLFANPDEDEPNAAIFSKDTLTISGSGSLTVVGSYNDGIASKDGLLISDGRISIQAADDGLRGKDYLVVQGGSITVNAQGDGLKADNAEDATLGFISIEGGVVQVTAGGDAIQAATDVMVTEGTLTLTSGGGSNGRIAETDSAKGIKAAGRVIIDQGTFIVSSADDAIHANDSILINSGDFTLASGDDAIHADASLTIGGGDIRISESYEGIESAVITINGGNIHIVASDDGLNVAGGVDGSGMTRGPGLGGGPGARPGRGAAPGQETTVYSGSYYLYINGGYVVIDAAGDGIDVNGAIEMSDGVVIVNGPTEQMNGALDYDASFKMTGGFLLAVGSAGMAQAPGASSTQNVLLLNLNGTAPANTLIHIQTSDGQELLTFAPTKAYQSITFSAPELAQGVSYDIYYGGSASGTAVDGLYRDGTYIPGNLYGSFTASTSVTQLGGGFR